MTLSNEAVASGVQRYLDTVATGTAADVRALFAADATIEDPVGATPISGHEAIEAFYATIEALPKTTELVTLRACTGQAAFHFSIVVDLGGGATSTMAPLEVMTFDDDGLITSMRAFWNDSDLVIA
ncbi:nuclear transport factor 2 family protein [Nocardioides rubriscoriae]|uniref:nuclear transport factor 2 family protein n=1 Tax=Nocardioides rubriscoriae TaxID=642762 RepID=UPI0011DF289D|nr:nuclear transport factor 2 family protein [Nocardioides rubriscoriae]